MISLTLWARWFIDEAHFTNVDLNVHIFIYDLSYKYISAMGGKGGGVGGVFGSPIRPWPRPGLCRFFERVNNINNGLSICGMGGRVNGGLVQGRPLTREVKREVMGRESNK